MSLDAITVLIEPPRVDVGATFPSGAGTVGRREFYRYERFAAEMAKHTSVAVSIVEDFLVHAPAKGMLLVHSTSDAMVDELPADRRQQVLRRVVLLQADGEFVLKDLEGFGYAGAILKRHYMEWLVQPDLALGTGLYGLRSIAAEIGADCEDEAPGIASKHYCYLTSDRFDDLPSLLVGYLEAVAR